MNSSRAHSVNELNMLTNEKSKRLKSNLKSKILFLMLRVQ